MKVAATVAILAAMPTVAYAVCPTTLTDCTGTPSYENVTIWGTLTAPVLTVGTSNSGTAGVSGTINAGTAGAGTNLSGGNLLLKAGGVTGTGVADVEMFASGGGGTGTTPGSPALVGDFGYSEVKLYSHFGILTGSGTPSAPTCGGTGSINGVDNDFDVTVGGSSTTTCTITFGQSFNTAPHVSLGLHTPAAGGVFVTSVSSTGMVLTFATATTSGVVSVIALPST